MAFKVRIVISKDFEFEVIALIDLGVDLNCTQEGIIPSKYFRKTRERLTFLNGGKMQIEFKIPKAHNCQDNVCFKMTFVLVKNMTDRVILRNPFMCLLYPFIMDSEGIITHPFGQLVKFKFLRSSKPRDISSLWEVSVSKTLNLIYAKAFPLTLSHGTNQAKNLDQFLPTISFTIDDSFGPNPSQKSSQYPTPYIHHKSICFMPSHVSNNCIFENEKIHYARLNISEQEKEQITYNTSTTSKWKMTSSAEKRNKGKAPAQGYPQDKRLPTGQSFAIYECVSSGVKPRGSTSFQEFVPAVVTYSNGDMAIAL